MVMNDGSKTNGEVFWDVFSSLYGDDALKDKDIFDSYYTEGFSEVRRPSSQSRDSWVRSTARYQATSHEYHIR